ncbi:MAG TPA: family 1 glycosylhydrolase, partial [Thermoanaerobaculia bacterium]
MTDKFLWGVATSAYQVEGAQENDWTEWERSGRLKDKRARCGLGSGHRQRWRSDLALLPTINANAYRYSVEWSRLEPKTGEFAQEELAREAERVRLLHALAVEPFVTLNHYTHPLWFWREGGWENAASVDRFARLAGVLAEALPQVRFWVTLNEPIVFILGGYLGGLIPPGQKRFSSAAAALENLLRAHVAASAAIRERIPDARVGMAHNMLAFAPDRPESALDKKLVAAGEALYNDALVEAVATGAMRWSFPGEGSTVFRVPDLLSSTGFFGVNYYSRVHIRFRGLPGALGEYLYRDPASRGLTDTGWEVRPEGFDAVLRQAAETGLPFSSPKTA